MFSLVNKEKEYRQTAQFVSVGRITSLYLRITLRSDSVIIHLTTLLHVSILRESPNVLT